MGRTRTRTNPVAAHMSLTARSLARELAALRREVDSSPGYADGYLAGREAGRAEGRVQGWDEGWEAGAEDADQSGQLSAAYELIDEQQQRISDLRAERDAASARAMAAESLAASREAAARAGGEGGEALAALLVAAHLPSSPVEACEALAAAFPGRLALLPSALSSARRYDGPADPVWHALHSLAVTFWGLRWGDDRVPPPKVAEAFEGATGLQFAWTDGPSVRRDPELAAMRRFEYRGEERDFSAHVKGGTRQHPLRVHLWLDEGERRVVVAHVGDHLPTSLAKRGRRP